MEVAIELARLCPPKESAYSVGAVIGYEHGNEVSRGYSRETDEHVHAEESALAKLADYDPCLKKATIYSTLEPCSQRKSRLLSCTRLILNAGIHRIVWRGANPSQFVADCQGSALPRLGTLRLLPRRNVQPLCVEPLVERPVVGGEPG